jgi:hypothetical protein
MREESKENDKTLVSKIVQVALLRVASNIRKRINACINKSGFSTLAVIITVTF